MNNELSNIMKIRLPVEWNIKSFNQICEFDKKTFDPTTQPEKIFNYISISDIEDYHIKSYQEIIGADAPSRARKLVYAGDIIISTVRPYLRAFAKITDEYNDFVCSTGFSVLSSKHTLSDYIYYLVQTEQFVQELMRRMVGATYPAVTSSDIKYLKVPVPPLVEQRGIVEVLGTVDECIRLTNVVIKRAEELKRGFMQQLLTRGIEHREFKETPLGEIPTTWKIHSISQLCELIVDCVNKTAPTVPFQTEYKMIRTSNIRNGRIDLSDVKYVTKEIYKKWTRREPPKKNDVILTREAPMGEVGIIQDEKNVFLGQRIVMYRCDPKRLDPFYLLYTFLSHPVQAQIHKLGSGSTVEHMRVPDSKKLEIITPPIGTQRKIADILRNKDKRIDIEHRKKIYLNLLKEGLTQILLSGKTRVELNGDELHRIRDGREAHH